MAKFLHFVREKPGSMGYGGPGVYGVAVREGERETEQRLHHLLERGLALAHAQVPAKERESVLNL